MKTIRSYNNWFGTRFFCGAALSLVLIFALVGESRAQSAGSFSRIGFGARGIALGNALGADISGAASPYYNPALAPFAERQNLSISVSSLSFDRSLQFLQLASPMQRAGIAFGLTHSAVSNIDGRDNSGFHTRELSVDEYHGFLAFGIKLSDKFAGGLSFQIFRTDLYDDLKPAVSIAVDFGLAYRLSESFNLAFVADDLLGRYTWNSTGVNGSDGKKTTDYFPTRLRFGATKRFLDGRLLIGAELESRTTKVETVAQSVSVFDTQPVEVSERATLTLQEWRGRAGVEYLVVPQLVLRTGLEQRGSDFLGGVRPSGGFMVNQEIGSLHARFEYTYAREVQASGAMHIFSLVLFF
jgi:hypothetical protein